MVTRSSLEREVSGSNLGPVKPNTVLPTACRSCGISLKEAVLPPGAMTQRWALHTRYTLPCKPGSVMKDLILIFSFNLSVQYLPLLSTQCFILEVVRKYDGIVVCE